MTAVIHPEAIDERFVPVGRADLGLVETDTETLVVSETGDVHRLNPTAALVWACCDGTGPIGDLVDELSEAYGADRAVIAADVVGIVREFGRNGLLEGVAVPEPEPAPVEASDEVDASAAVAEACPEPTVSEPVESDVPLPRYLIVPPSS